jgi:Fe-Mn family superoxide dismutase
MAFELPALPYKNDALAPAISAETLNFHHGKHHATYVDRLNGAIKGTEQESQSLEDVIRWSAADASRTGIFNNAAQTWNHTFFWESMKPNGGGKPSGDLASAIDSSFGGFDKFREKFLTAGAGQFGSGWVWLVADKGKLEVVTTSNAGTPLTAGKTALITCDVWEHAYYLDYQNRRPDFLATFMDKLVNWDFAARNLKG